MSVLLYVYPPVSPNLNDMDEGMVEEDDPMARPPCSLAARYSDWTESEGQGGGNMF